MLTLRLVSSLAGSQASPASVLLTRSPLPCFALHSPASETWSCRIPSRSSETLAWRSGFHPASSRYDGPVDGPNTHDPSADRRYRDRRFRNLFGICSVSMSAPHGLPPSTSRTSFAVQANFPGSRVGSPIALMVNKGGEVEPDRRETRMAISASGGKKPEHCFRLPQVRLTPPPGKTDAAGRMDRRP